MSSKKPSKSQHKAGPKKAPKSSPKSKKSLASNIIPIARDSKIKSSMSIQARTDLSYVRIKGVEPILSVSSTSPFTVAMDEYVNPLNPILFPKLSQEAALYDKWRPVKIRLRYVPRCPTTLAGQVGLLILPDVHVSEAPATMIELDRYEHAISSALWTPSECAYEEKFDTLKWYFTAPPAEFVGSTLGTDRTAASGVVQIATSDCNTPGLLAGVVYLDYDIEFCERRPPYVSAFSVSTTTGNVTGTGSTINKFVNQSVTNVLNNYFGNPLNWVSAAPPNDTMLPVGGGTASYIAAFGAGGALALNNFLKLHKGLSRLSGQFGFAATTTPLINDDYVPVKPALVRQIGYEKKVVEPPVDYRYIDARADGTVWGSNDKVVWVELTSEGLHDRAPLAVDDIAGYLGLYDPVSNVSTIIMTVVANSNAAYNINYVKDITVSTSYPQWVVPFTGSTTASGSSRNQFWTVCGINQDST